MPWCNGAPRRALALYRAQPRNLKGRFDMFDISPITIIMYVAGIGAVYCAFAVAYFTGHDNGHSVGFNAGWHSWHDTPPLCNCDCDAAYNDGHTAGSHSSYERGCSDGMTDALEMLNALQAGETLTPHALTLFDRAVANVSNAPAPGIVELSLTYNA